MIPTGSHDKRSPPLKGFLFRLTSALRLLTLLFFFVLTSLTDGMVIPRSPAQRLWDLLEEQAQTSDGMPLLMPCCYDGLTARLVARAGFQATFMTGFGVSAANGYPDTQLVSYAEMVAAAQSVAEGLSSAALELEFEAPHVRPPTRPWRPRRRPRRRRRSRRREYDDDEDYYESDRMMMDDGVMDVEYNETYDEYDTNYNNQNSYDNTGGYNNDNTYGSGNYNTNNDGYNNNNPQDYNNDQGSTDVRGVRLYNNEEGAYNEDYEDDYSDDEEEDFEEDFEFYQDFGPIPCIADGDTGYGNAINAKRTVFGYGRAGMAGVMIEDQVAPKRCGHVGGKQVVSFDEAVQRVKAACDARDEYNALYGPGTGPLILARTDALATEGFEAAIERCIAFREIAGCDMTFLEAPESIEQMEEYCRRVPGPKLANMLEHGTTPILPPEELKRMGYSMAAYPLTLLSASIRAMQESLDRIMDGVPTEDIILSFEDTKDAVGFNWYGREADMYGTPGEDFPDRRNRRRPFWNRLLG